MNMNQNTAVAYLAILFCSILISYFAVRYVRLLDDIHAIAGDMRAIRNALAPEPVKMRANVDYRDRERQQPRITTL